jgi:hypothetical protein
MYKKRSRALPQHTPHLEPLHLTPLFYILVVFGASKSYLGELGSLEERNLGMNNMKSSSRVLLSFYQYSCAYELDYSFHVMILTYELAYSFYVMNLTCRTLCLIFHITYMIRIRAKLRWWFVIPLGLPMSYACQSVGLESQGDMGSFFVHGRGARMHENH